MLFRCRFLLILALQIMYYSNYSQDQIVQDWVKKLSIEQKVNIVVGIGMTMPGLSQGEKENRVDGAAGATYDIPELSIPSMVLADGPAGVRISPIRESDSTRNYYCTAFPIATNLASTWDVDLIREVGMAMGAEAKEYGVDIILGPGMNIHRNPLCGRNFEYFSEDPYLSGYLAAAIVNGIESNGIGTSVKHFAVNNQETNRMKINAYLSERALREIYLRGFEIVVKEAQPWTVMSAYNKINGTYASQNKELLTNVLRDEWGYEGIVVTDWFAGDDPVAQMKAGNDLLMPGTPDQKKKLLDAIENGELEVSILDQNVSRILNKVVESPIYKQYQYSDNPDLIKHAAIARKAASEGIVLLKNETALPIEKKKLKIAAFGNGSYEFISGGTGSGDVNEAYTVSLVQGLKNANYKVDSELMNIYTEYMLAEKEKQPKQRFFFQLMPPIAEMSLDDNLVQKQAKKSDIALITIGRNSGEFQDRQIEGDFNLTKAELKMIQKVSKAFRTQGKKVIAVLNIGNVIETAKWKEYVDAIVLAWQGGQEAGNALTDVLLGKVNPSGKLPSSFPISYEDTPSTAFFPGEEFPDAEEQRMGFISMGKESEVAYNEDIFVGYRHFVANEEKVSYPFGFGLSYTEFDYKNIITSTDLFESTIKISVEIENIGDVAGKEVVQLYLTAPKGFIEKPLMELKGFAKTRILQTGEKQTLSFVLNPKDLASFYVEQSAWIADQGTYSIKIGSSSTDIRLEGEFELKEDLVVEKVNRILLPQSLKPEPIDQSIAPFTIERDVKWASPEGYDLTMDIYTPNSGKESYPVIIMFHGGGWLVNNKSIMKDASAYLATNGEYVVCNVDYRLLVDMGNTVTMDEIIGDAFGAVLWVKENIENYKGNKNKVIITGDSAGGHLATMVALHGDKLSIDGYLPSGKGFLPSYLPANTTIEQVINRGMINVQAAIISYGAFDIYATAKFGGLEKPSNFFWTMGNATARGIFGDDFNYEDNPELYKGTSPIYLVEGNSDKRNLPILFTVGSNDMLTTPKSIKDYMAILKEAGFSNMEYWENEGRPHAFLDSGSNEFLNTSFQKDAIPALKKMLEFLNAIFYAD